MARPSKKAQAAAATAAAQPAQPVPMGPPPIPVAQQQMPPPPQPLPVLAAQPMTDAITVSRSEYIRVRDSVHARLATIQGLISSFATDYLRQSSLLLGEPASLDSIASVQALAGLDNAHVPLGFAHPLPEAAVPAIEEKKERKKRVHDPNAPKRPLTPYFLYMQTARPIIAGDLVDAPKGAVQEEGQRRWAAMGAQEKSAWNDAYQYNLRLYNARVHSYKSGNLDARNMSDKDALAYADAHQIAHPPIPAAEIVEDGPAPTEQEAILQQLQQISPPAAPEAPEEVEEVKATPKPKGTRKRKSTAAAEAEEVETAKATPQPEKKRKRQSKGAVADTPEVEPKKSARKKRGTGSA